MFWNEIKKNIKYDHDKNIIMLIMIESI